MSWIYVPTPSPDLLPIASITEAIEAEERGVNTDELFRQANEPLQSIAERSLRNPTYFPITEIEIKARQILEEDYHSDKYLSELVVRINHAVNTLDLFRETGFTLSTPESILESLEDMCAMF